MPKRVYQIAKALDIKSSALLPDLLAMGYEVTSAASTVTDAEADEILAAFREAGGSDEHGAADAGAEPDRGQTEDEALPGGDEEGVNVTMIEPDGTEEPEAEDTPTTEADPAALRAEAAQRKRERLVRQMQALLDDPAADLETGLAGLLEGEDVPLGRRWRLFGKGSVTHQSVQAKKGETISDDQYVTLTSRVKAFFEVVDPA